MIAREAITGVILCGGAGERLGQGEKPLVLLDGEPLVAHVRARLAPHVGQFIISANRDHDRYGVWGDRVLADRVPGLGPLGGLVTALEACETPYLFCCPGDVPFVPLDVVVRLGAALEEPDCMLAVPYDGEQVQQLVLCCRVTVRQSLEAFLAAGGRAVHEWIDTESSAIVAMPSARAGFLNVNTKADIELARLGLLAGLFE